jgi:RNA polymerase sigma-70 factor (ECF subfamily)
VQVARPFDIIAEDADERLKSLFHEYYQGLVGLLYRLVGNREESEELAQEAFIRLARHPIIWRPPDEVLAWLRRVSLNLGYNALRSRKRELERLQKNARLSEPLADSTDGPEARVLRSEEIVRVRLALAQLPERHQMCLLLRYGGLSYKEIAQVLNVAPGSVGTLLARAEDAFRLRYES